MAIEGKVHEHVMKNMNLNKVARVKKIIFSLIFSVASLYGDITNEELKIFINISQKDKLYKDILTTQKLRIIDLMGKIDIEMKFILDNPKYKEVYFDSFRSLTHGEYESALEFYQSSIGKKFKNIRFYTYDNQAARDYVFSRAENLKLSNKQKKLIYEIVKKLGVIEKYMYRLKKKYLANNNEKSKYDLDRFLKNNKEFIESWSFTCLAIQLNNYSTDDLEKLNTFIDSTGKREFELSYIGYNRVFKEFMIAYDIQLCKKYNVHADYPDFCKSEWLNQNELNKTKINHYEVTQDRNLTTVK